MWRTRGAGKFGAQRPRGSRPQDGGEIFQRRRLEGRDAGLALERHAGMGLDESWERETNGVSPGAFHRLNGGVSGHAKRPSAAA